MLIRMSKYGMGRLVDSNDSYTINKLVNDGYAVDVDEDNKPKTFDTMTSAKEVISNKQVADLIGKLEQVEPAKEPSGQVVKTEQEIKTK
jgi:hypothetical protein